MGRFFRGFVVCLGYRFFKRMRPLGTPLQLVYQMSLKQWSITTPFNNMPTLKFKAQPTNAFFATVNQMFGGSSKPPTTTERAVIKSLCTAQKTKQCSAVVVTWEKPPNICLTAAKNAFVGRLLNFRVRMLLNSAVKETLFLQRPCHVTFWYPCRLQNQASKERFRGTQLETMKSYNFIFL